MSHSSLAYILYQKYLDIFCRSNLLWVVSIFVFESILWFSGWDYSISKFKPALSSSYSTLFFCWLTMSVSYEGSVKTIVTTANEFNCKNPNSSKLKQRVPSLIPISIFCPHLNTRKIRYDKNIAESAIGRATSFISWTSVLVLNWILWTEYSCRWDISCIATFDHRWRLHRSIQFRKVFMHNLLIICTLHMYKATYQSINWHLYHSINSMVEQRAYYICICYVLQLANFVSHSFSWNAVVDFV